MKSCPIFVVLGLFATLTALAKDGGLLQTGSVSVTRLDDGSGIPSVGLSITTNLFDRHGNMTQSLTWDFDGDGALDALTTYTSYSDKHGALISLVQDSDANADGIVDSRIIYTNLTSNQEVVLFDNNGDGVIDMIWTSTFTYTNGLLLGVLTKEDTNADGVPDFQWVESWTYDITPNQITFTEETDLYTPGMPQVVLTETYVLDEEGRPISDAWSQTSFGFEVTGSSEFAYDKFGNLLQETDGWSYSTALGHYKYSVATTYIYAHRGQIIREAPLDTRPRAAWLLDPTSRFWGPRKPTSVLNY